MKNQRDSWLVIAVLALVTGNPLNSLHAADGGARFIPEGDLNRASLNRASLNGASLNGASTSSGIRDSMYVDRTPSEKATGPEWMGPPNGGEFNPLPWGMGPDCTNDCCMDDCCGPPCCVLPEFPPPWIYVRMRFLSLMRADNRFVGFQSLGEITADGTLDYVLSSNTVEFPFQGGGEVTAGWSFIPRYYLEFTYFELSSWDEQGAWRDSETNSEGGTGTLFSPFGEFGIDPIAQFDYNNFAFVQYHSHLNNYELNLRHDLRMPPYGLRASVLFGGRAMRIDENFAYQTTSNLPALGGTENTISTLTKNRLLGLQIGSLLEFHVDPCWWINFEMKGAICENKIDLDSVYNRASGTGGSATYAHNRNEGNTSFVGELALSFMYEHNRHLTCEVGYRAMWITGLALASENLETDPGLLVLGPLNVVEDGQVVYHGPHAGLTVRW